MFIIDIFLIVSIIVGMRMDNSYGKNRRQQERNSKNNESHENTEKVNPLKEENEGKEDGKDTNVNVQASSLA
jgi:choline-glycine betaine transporter